MPNNTLYNFLQSGPFLPKGIRSVQATTVREQKYRRLDIENTKDIILSDAKDIYTLTHHHISVFEFEDPAIPELSQYHYTAYFRGAEGATYQLHIYYNEQDMLTTDPTFAKINADGSTSSLSIDTLYLQFLDIAKLACKAFMGELRIQFKELVERLTAEYKAKEREASSIIEVEPLDHRLYCDKLDGALRVLVQLDSFVKHAHYQKYYQLLQKIKTIIEKDHLMLRKGTNIDSEKPEPALIPMASITGGASSKKAKPIIMMDKDIEKLVVSYTEISREDHATLVSSLVFILNRLYQLSFDLEDHGRSASSSAMMQLQKLHSRLIQEVEALFPKLLIGEQFELLDELRAFHYLITPKFLNVALQMNNIRLLNYILSHGDFDLHIQAVTVRKTSYLNAVQFCYKTFNADCLQVLLQHNASILEIGDDGLPLLHTILSTPAHPLKQALFKAECMGSKLMNSIPLYKQMIALLTNYIKNPGLDPAMCRDIKGHIDIYNRHISSLKQISTSASGHALKSAVTGITNKHESTLFVLRLKSNPIYMGLVDLLMQQIHRYVLMLSPLQRRTFERESAQYINRISESLSAMDTSKLSFEHVLEQSCIYIRKCLDLTAKKIRFHQVKQEINALHGNLFKVNRNAKAKCREHDSLVEEINRMISDITKPLSFESDLTKSKSEVDDFIELLESMKHTIDGLCRDAEHHMVVLETDDTHHLRP